MTIDVVETGAATEMPRYECHKKVWALKIAAIEFEANGDAKIAPANDKSKGDTFAPFAVKDFFRKFGGGNPWQDLCDEQGENIDLGYYVQYEGDGYVSWSPTKAFEEGYTRI